METFHCSGCLQNKPEDAFYRCVKYGKPYRRPKCRACETLDRRRRRASPRRGMSKFGYERGSGTTCECGNVKSGGLTACFRCLDLDGWSHGEQLVIAALRSLEIATLADLVEYTGLSARSVLRNLAQLRKSGRVIRRLDTREGVEQNKRFNYRKITVRVRYNPAVAVFALS